jgi:hypothetical protein
VDVSAFEVSAAGSLGVAVLRVVHDRESVALVVEVFGGRVCHRGRVQDRVPLADVGGAVRIPRGLQGQPLMKRRVR